MGNPKNKNPIGLYIHLNVQGRPDLRAGLCCFLCPNTT